jgi:multifunctional methyltransferase subunit TRM112
MRLLTHNHLRSLAKGVTKGYPLLIEVGELEVVECEFKPDFLKDILPTLDWETLKVAADAIGFAGLPETFDTAHLADNDFLLAMHRLLLDIEVMEGALVCPETGRKFPIKNGIPDMKMAESEL